MWLRQVPRWVERLNGSETPVYVSADHAAYGAPTLRVGRLERGRFYRFRYGDGTTFVLDREGTNVWVNWPSALTLEDAATYLLGPVLGFVLRLRGVTCLHASAIAVDGRAFALVGPPGAGKSTAAAAFARRGVRVLSDDNVALHQFRRTVRVQPGNPRIRLWPAAVSLLYGAPNALPLLTPNWTKRFVDLAGDALFQEQPLPLGAIYLLEERRKDDGAPRLEPLPASRALISLIANTYTNYLLDRNMRAREFELLGDVVMSIPIRRVVPHTNPGYVTRLCDVLLEDFQAVCGTRT